MVEFLLRDIFEVATETAKSMLTRYKKTQKAQVRTSLGYHLKNF
jgi:hypothetical protein